MGTEYGSKGAALKFLSNFQVSVGWVFSECLFVFWAWATYSLDFGIILDGVLDIVPVASRRLDSAMFVWWGSVFLCFSLQFTWLDSSCELCFWGGGFKGSVLPALTGLFGECFVHAWSRGQLEMWTQFILRIWDVLFLAPSFLGFPLHIPAAEAPQDSVFSFSKPVKLWVSGL